MEWELYTESIREVVREGYRVLLTAEATLALPVGMERIGQFYRQMCRACLEWVKQGEGERLRREYLAFEDPMERARMAGARYTLRCVPVYRDEHYAAWECVSILRSDTGLPRERRMAQTWCLSEQTGLPFGQILRAFPTQKRERPAFRPDGVYPKGDLLVFYRNGEGQEAVREALFPLKKGDEDTEKGHKKRKEGKKVRKEQEK